VRSLHVALRWCCLAAGAVLILTAGSGGSAEISDYRVATGWAIEKGTGRRSVALRSFALDRVRQRLLVDPATLATCVARADEVAFTASRWSALQASLADTPYGRVITQAQRRDAPASDAGIDHVAASANGVDLTVDLCPSRHPLDRRLFTELIREMGDVERPVPVAVAITGVWIRAHPADLAWLLEVERSGALAITWVNHSFHHRVDPKAPLSRNFLLDPGTNIRREVLETEAALLALGLTPSVFFRFPGLVSSRRLVRTVVGYGLIPVGSDAWLAKGQTPQPGSIVLVHANGNEPLGVKRFLALLASERAETRARRWLLLDLRETVEEAATAGR
jgi:hypothetical protein